MCSPKFKVTQPFRFLPANALCLILLLLSSSTLPALGEPRTAKAKFSSTVWCVLHPVAASSVRQLGSNPLNVFLALQRQRCWMFPSSSFFSKVPPLPFLKSFATSSLEAPGLTSSFPC